MDQDNAIDEIDASHAFKDIVNGWHHGSYCALNLEVFLQPWGLHNSYENPVFRKNNFSVLWVG